ncbi:MAG: hypothetical protein EHM13_06650, partial [Acidobacteria bacterium]
MRLTFLMSNVAWPRSVRVTPEPRVNCGVNGTETAGAAGSLEHPIAGRNSSKTTSRDMVHLPILVGSSNGSRSSAARGWSGPGLPVRGGGLGWESLGRVRHVTVPSAVISDDAPPAGFSGMFELRTLGALELSSAESNAVRSVLAQPRRAALLCYLALAVPRGFHRRDTVFALFWPEDDAEHARHALRQSVYGLRRALGPETIVSRGDDELGLAPDQIRCDVWAFEAAVDQGRAADALALYRGELLPGFHISAAPDFERWLEEERSRLRQRAREAAWALAAARERDGDAVGAAEAAQQAVALSPAEEAALRRLVLLLERVGDRAGAVRAYETFASRLRGEYELEPSAEMQA